MIVLNTLSSANDGPKTLLKGAHNHHFDKIWDV